MEKEEKVKKRRDSRNKFKSMEKFGTFTVLIDI